MIRATTPDASRSKRSRPDPDEHAFQRLKTSIHEELVESLDLSLIGTLDRQRLGLEVRNVADSLCRERASALDSRDRQRLLDELLDEVFGLGPLEPLMADPTITDILVNHAFEVYVERHGRLELTDVIFADDQHVLRVIQRIVARIGRRIDEVCPMVDARLPDGSRINAVVPPLSLKGPTLSIRRFGDKPLDLNDLMSGRSILPDMVQFLSAAVDARLSFLISGGTGSGKTTLLNALSVCVPPGERIITIEDSAELKLQHLHVVSLEARMFNTEGAGEITARDLVRNALRMRPDRILVGEVRGPEALDMLQAMNTGHEGSLTTIHANDTRDALSRLEMMVAMTGLEIPVHVVREYIAAGIKLVVHLARLKGGVRRVMRVSEVVGIQDGEYQLQEIFGFKQQGVGEDGLAFGRFYATGYRPKCLERMRAGGVELPDELFEAKEY
jgi:pilus assembly protein CpaF